MSRTKAPRIRNDGWTVRRQAAFLDVLRRTRSVAEAARSVGMSRESAFRLRRRDPDGLFATMWALSFPPRVVLTQAQVDEAHIRLIRLACGSEGKNFRFDRAASSKA